MEGKSSDFIGIETRVWQTRYRTHSYNGRIASTAKRSLCDSDTECPDLIATGGRCLLYGSSLLLVSFTRSRIRWNRGSDLIPTNASSLKEPDTAGRSECMRLSGGDHHVCPALLFPGRPGLRNDVVSKLRRHLCKFVLTPEKGIDHGRIKL